MARSAEQYHWFGVQRTGGLLPPGFRKRIDDDFTRGVTYWWRIPVGGFDVQRLSDDSLALHYRLWPLRDEITMGRDHAGNTTPGAWEGVGYAFGIRFCTFRLV